jgi:hypothetical protein
VCVIIKRMEIGKHKKRYSKISVEVLTAVFRSELSLWDWC